MIGSTISHYRILEKLGEGGMGVVYEARDTALDRFVALKFLAPHLVSNAEVRKRFIREAKTTAALQHPNICTVFEIGEADGRTFIAMSCLEGRELADEIAEGPLEPKRALDLAIQFAEGLAEAHSKGVVHRDIKPANLFVTSAGRGVILDFGLAQLASADSKLTREGATVGTCAYMSPEQATGADVDARTDVWALGCVFYEMLAGQPPFRGHYEQAIVYSILNGDPEPLAASRSDLDPGWIQLIDQCLAKRAEQRCADAGELLAELRRIRDRRHSIPIQQPATGPRDERPSVLVLPFVNGNRDEEGEFLSDGITEDIINALTSVDGLKTQPRSVSFRYKGSDQDARELGAKLGVDAVLEGSVRRLGKRLRIFAALIGPADGYPIWSDRYDRVMDDIFDIQDEISQAIVDGLKVTLSSGRKGLAARPTENIEAYELYLKGRYCWNETRCEAYRRSIQYFEQAVELDPGFADALAAQSFAYYYAAMFGSANPRDSMAIARTLATRAIRANDESAYAYFADAVVRFWAEWDIPGAERAFQRSIQLDPKNGRTRIFYAFLLSSTQREHEAVEEAQRGIEAEPLDLEINREAVYIFYVSHRHEKAIAQATQVCEMYPNFFGPWEWLGFANHAAGNHEAALAAFEKAKSLAPDEPLADFGMVIGYSGVGRSEEARELIERFESHREGVGLSWGVIALAYAILGDADPMFKSLEHAYEEHNSFMLTLRDNIGFRDYQDDARMQELIRRVGI